MNKQKNKTIQIVIFVFFIILGILFFLKGFLGGNAILGTDSNYAMRTLYQMQFQDGITKLWIPYWLGLKGATFNPTAWFISTKFLPMQFSLTFAYAFDVIVALIFMFLLLRKLKLKIPAAILGAAAYAFTPHFLTVILPGHPGTMDILPLAPIMFLSLFIAFDREDKKNVLKQIVAIIWAGVSWGLMMGDDPQRGIYFSAVGAVFILIRLIEHITQRDKKAEPITWIKPLIGDAVKSVAILAVLMMGFASGLSGWLSSESLSGEAVGVEDTEESKWNFATSYAYPPSDTVDFIAFGYHGKLASDADNLYWGKRDYAGNSHSIGYFVVLFGLIGAIYAFAKIKERGQPATFRFFAVAGLVALLMSFGDSFPGSPFFWIWFKLPLMDKFRAPDKFISVVSFCAALVSAYGLNRILEIAEDEAKRKKTFDLIWKVLAGFLVVGIIWLIVVNSQTASKLVSSAYLNYAKSIKGNMVDALAVMNVFTALSLAVFFIFARIKKEPRQMEYLISAPFIILMIINLWSIDWYYINQSYFKPADYFAKDGVIQYLETDDEISRVALSLKFPYGDQMIPLSLHQSKNSYMTYYFPHFQLEAFDTTAMSRIADDYNNYFLTILQSSLEDTNRVDFQQLSLLLQGMDGDNSEMIDLNLRLYRLANVKYLITDGYISELGSIILYNMVSNENTKFVGQTQTFSGGNAYIFELNDTLPRAGFYENYYVVSDNEDALDFISMIEWDIRSDVVIYSTNTGFDSYFESDEEVVPQEITEYSSWYAEIEVDAPRDGILLFNNKYSADWKATLDGEPVEIFPANYIMQGIQVPEGEHEVVFEYSPSRTPYLISLAALLIGLISIAGYGVYSLVKKDED